jgi:hypothetical protein
MWPKGKVRPTIDLTNMKFGRLTVAREITVTGGERRFLCLCLCGKGKEVSYSNLKSGHVKSCGCYGADIRANAAILTVAYQGVTKTLKQWSKDLNINYHTLFTRICVNKWSTEKAFSKPKTKHKMSNTKLYKVWSSMKCRCQNPNDQSYANYGGRGIGLWSGWQEFTPFYEWAHKNGYKAGLTIERIDNNRDYCPTNCTWISKGQQSNNTRRCKMIEHNGECHNLKDWSIKVGLPYCVLQSRLKKLGWSIDKALSEPIIEPSLKHSKKRMIQEVQRATGIPTYACAE